MSLLEKFTQGFSQVTNLFSKQTVGSGENSDGISKTEQTSFWAGIFAGKNTSTPGFNSNTGLNFTAQKIKLTNDDIKKALARQAQRENPTQIKPAKPDHGGDPRLELPAPKAIIIPLNAGRRQAGYDELARRTTEATLRQNGINPSNIEMEELMALPGSKNLDMNGWLDKNWKFHDLPGLMPEAGKHQDINGTEINGYKFTLSPKFQQSIIDDYKKIKGELALTPDKKAVVEMSLNERMSEAIRIALDKGYISKEISAELNKLTPDQLAAAFGIGGAVGLAAKTGAKSLIPVLGTGLAFKEGLEQYAEFEGFALGCAKATSREDLDRPAQEFGKWMGKLSKDGVMAVTAWAGAKIAPAVMPTATAKAEQVVTSTVKGVKEAMTKTNSLDDAVLATPEGVTVKMPTSKTPLEKISEPMEVRRMGNEPFTKPVSFPSYKKVKIDMNEVITGHKVGGSRLQEGNKKSLFPEDWSEEKIEMAVREAYKNADTVLKRQINNKTGDERLELEGSAKGWRIRFWYNKTTQEIETAFPNRADVK